MATEGVTGVAVKVVEAAGAAVKAAAGRVVDRAAVMVGSWEGVVRGVAVRGVGMVLG